MSFEMVFPLCFLFEIRLVLMLHFSLGLALMGLTFFLFKLTLGCQELLYTRIAHTCLLPCLLALNKVGQYLLEEYLYM